MAGEQAVFPIYGPSGGLASAYIFYFVTGFQVWNKSPHADAYIDNLAIPTGHRPLGRSGCLWAGCFLFVPLKSAGLQATAAKVWPSISAHSMVKPYFGEPRRNSQSAV